MKKIFGVCGLWMLILALAAAIFFLWKRPEAHEIREGQTLVRRMCQRGELPAHKEGPRLWRIDKNAALEQRQEAMEICQRNAKKAPKNKKPAGAGTPTSFRVTG